MVSINAKLKGCATRKKERTKSIETAETFKIRQTNRKKIAMMKLRTEWEELGLLKMEAKL